MLNAGVAVLTFVKWEVVANDRTDQGLQGHQCVSSLGASCNTSLPSIAHTPRYPLFLAECYRKKEERYLLEAQRLGLRVSLRVPVKADRPGYPQVKREFERSALSLIAEDTPLLKLSLMVRGFGLSHLPIQAQIAKLVPNVFEIP